MRLQTLDSLRSAFGEGHAIERPKHWRAPVIFASPHSGAIYPRAFRMGSPLSLSDLRRNEDAFVDQLFADAPRWGAPLLKAHFPRCFVDANRPGDDLPPEWGEVSTGLKGQEGPKSTYRARMGLGVVPSVIGENMPIFRKTPSRFAIEARIEALYRPYHRALSDLITQAQAEFGRALLVDCHSMPGFAPSRRAGALRTTRGPRRPDIILGDGHGTTAHGATMDMFQNLFERAGYEVVRNHPYAGGFATRHYGRPENGVEAVQIEINRDLYLERGARLPTPSAGFEELFRDISALMAEVIARRMPRELSEAAE